VTALVVAFVVIQNQGPGAPVITVEHSTSGMP
jgi:hypothetical protein